MAENSKIEWTDNTFNAWIGCAKVSPACKVCYAEVQTFVRIARSQGRELWGLDAGRHVVSEDKWREPGRWNQQAGDAGKRTKVFCRSLMDVWEDRPDLETPRARLLQLARDCTHLDWQFLSKRPENANVCLSRSGPREGGQTWLDVQRESPARHWWFGCTVEDRRRAEERIPALLEIPARVRFLSCEPLLESLDLSPWLAGGGIHWVIVGGESHRSPRQARQFDLLWAEEIIGQCRQHKVPVFVKQTGCHVVEDGTLLRLMKSKGGDLNEWPEWLRKREVPRV